MQKHLRIFILSLIILITTGAQSFAEPAIKICIEDNCKKPLTVTISNACWTETKELFSSLFPTDKDEQDNIINAIALIETDIYTTLAKQKNNEDDAGDLYANNSVKNNYRNIKNYIAMLLDNHMIKRHVMRKTIVQHGWAGFNSNGLLLQSLTDSKLYILESNSNELGTSPLIRNYMKPSDIKAETNALEDDEMLDDDFE